MAKKPSPQKAAASRRQGLDQMARLLEIMARLRNPKGGCPWDLEQTIESIKANMLEEAYEALDAIESGNREDLVEELGDLLLQIVFQAQIGFEEGSFAFKDVAKGISDKLVNRHPHIFGTTKVKDADEVLRNWDEIKLQEKKARKSALDGVPKHVPVLQRTYQLQKRAARVGFDWDNIADVFEKLEEEIRELKEAIAKKKRLAVIEELGDLLFSVVNIARFVKVDPAYALERTNTKFSRRFRVVEKELEAGGKKLSEFSLDEMEVIWNRQRAEDKR